MVNIVNIITDMLFIYNMPNLPFFRINLTLFGGKWNFCGKMMANGMVLEEKLALITTEDDTNQPEHFHYSFYSTQLHYTYNTYKFLDHNMEELKQYDNPFAFAVIAAKYANRYKKDYEKRYHFKGRLFEQVVRRFHSNDEKAQTYLYALFYFIDFLLKVPADLQNKLERNIVKRLRKEDISMMEAKRMEPSPTLKAIIREYAKTAEEQGLERGLEKGIKQTTVKFAKKLIDKDYSNEFVAEMTGLLQEEIEAIRKS